MAMIGENLASFFLLYVKPVSAISRLLDRGRLWLAIVLAALVGVVTHVPRQVQAVDVMGEAVAKSTRHLIEAQRNGESTENAVAEASRIVTDAAQGRRETSAVFTGVVGEWTGAASSSFAPLFAVLMAFVPAMVAFRAVSGYGSFGVLMRGEYLSLMMCSLYAWAAAYLPVAALVWVAGPYTEWLFLAANVYFLGLTALSVRTLTGGRLGMAAGAVAVGCAAAMAGLAGYELAGYVRGYLLSPFLLYYAYALFLSDVRALGDGLRARQHLSRQLEISTTNPRDADAHYQLGLIYQKRRQYSEAIPRFERAIEIDPSEGDAHLQLGRIALGQGRSQDAIRHLTNAASIDEKLSSSEVWRDLGAAYFAAGDTQAAADALEKYASRRPYDPEGLFRLGKTLATLGQTQAARERFEECVEAVKTAPSHRRAYVRHWSGEAKSALRALK